MIQRQLPKYRCHKEVYALKIAAIEVHEDQSATIVPDDKRYAIFRTESGWANRFKGGDTEDLGYYVVYEDGYKSWSPTKAFDDGYTLV